MSARTRAPDRFKVDGSMQSIRLPESAFDPWQNGIRRAALSGRRTHRPESVAYTPARPSGFASLQIRLDQLNCHIIEEHGALRIQVKLRVSAVPSHAPLVTPWGPEGLLPALELQAELNLTVPCGTSCLNPPTGGGDTAMVMQYQFDALGAQGLLCGTTFHDYPPYDDAPEEFNFWGWVANIAIGVAVAIVCVALALATAGTSLVLTGALAGAALGAGVITTVIAVQDYQDGEVRSWQTATAQILAGAVVGAAIGGAAGALIQYAPAIMNGLKSIPGLLNDFASSSLQLIPPISVPFFDGTSGLLFGGLSISGQAVLQGMGAITGVALGEGLFLFSKKYFDDDSPRSERIGKQYGDASRNNQVQNREAKYARSKGETELGRKLTEDEWKRVHSGIRHQGLSVQEIIEEILRLFGGG